MGTPPPCACARQACDARVPRRRRRRKVGRSFSFSWAPRVCRKTATSVRASDDTLTPSSPAASTFAPAPVHPPPRHISCCMLSSPSFNPVSPSHQPPVPRPRPRRHAQAASETITGNMESMDTRMSTQMSTMHASMSTQMSTMHASMSTQMSTMQSRLTVRCPTASPNQPHRPTASPIVQGARRSGRIV